MINTTTEACEAGATYIRDTRDNKLYKTITIGTQVWTAQNMNYLTSNSYCYNNDVSNCDKYGRLYTWEAAKSACPAGYHLPSNAEWDVLLKFVLADNNLGTTNKAGTYLKSKTGWNPYNGIPAGNDKYGFNGFPAGLRNSDGSYNNMGYSGYFWSSTESSSTGAYYYHLHNYGEALGRTGDYNKKSAGSVRCVKD